MPNSTPATPAQSLERLQIVLPDAPKPVASYVPARQSGNQVFISGQIPMASGSLLATGAVPSQVSIEQAIECARQCTLNCLANLQNHLGDLGKVTKVVRVGVFVASDPGFGSQPQIANGCSDLLVEIFGESIGQHARAAVGVSALPLDVPVEIEFIFEVE
jgi:enamine deaminase RidA (YjgF/YER057c/UK114 family)